MKSRRQWLIVAVLAVLLAVVLVVQVWPLLRQLAPAGLRLGGAKPADVTALTTELRDLDKAAAARQAQVDETRLLAGFLWTDGAGAAPRVKERLEQLGRQTSLTFERLDAPTVADLGPRLAAIEVRLTANVPIEPLAAFLHTLAAERPLLDVYTLTLRPDFRNPRLVNLVAVVRAYILKPEAEALLREAGKS